MIARVIEVQGEPIVGALDQYALVAELSAHGYGLGDVKKQIASSPNREGENDDARYLRELRKYTVGRIVALERRASTFSEMHPLSLQTSPIDGVSRGIIVCRTLAKTEEAIEKLMLGTMEYYFAEDDSEARCVLLRDRLTDSPVRVVTKDAVLGTAFWSTFNRLRGRFPQPTFDWGIEED